MNENPTMDDWLGQGPPLSSTRKHLLPTAAANTGIALIIHGAGIFQADLVQVFVLCQCIGLAICLGINTAFILIQPRRALGRLALTAVAIVAGTVAGIAAGVLFTGLRPAPGHPAHGQRGGCPLFPVIGQVHRSIDRRRGSPHHPPIRELAATLDPDRFWQIHRGAIVHVGHIADISRSLTGKQVIRLRGSGETLTVSRTFAHRFKQM